MKTVNTTSRGTRFHCAAVNSPLPGSRANLRAHWIGMDEPRLDAVKMGQRWVEEKKYLK